MKKHFIAIAKVLLTIVAAIGLACAAVCMDMNDAAVLAAFFCGGVLIALALGLFDISEPIKHWSIKQGARSMRRAA